MLRTALFATAAALLLSGCVTPETATRGFAAPSAASVSSGSGVYQDPVATNVVILHSNDGITHENLTAALQTWFACPSGQTPKNDIFTSADFGGGQFIRKSFKQPEKVLAYLSKAADPVRNLLKITTNSDLNPARLTGARVDAAQFVQPQSLEFWTVGEHACG